jgi:hypothetical protein
LIGSPVGGTFSVPNPYTGPSTNYTYTYTNGSGCTNTSSPSAIAVNPVTASNIVLTGTGSVCETLNQISGANLYSNSSCQLITNISASGLGSTISCINFLPGTPVWNGEPYANRVYSITPTTQPTTTATVCLYYTPSDLAAAGITADTNISITKVGGNGILGGPGLVTEILNSNMTINTLSGGNKEVCFPVSSFSSFYLHSKNPNNVALPVSVINFRGKILANSDLIEWTSISEINHQYFNLQHSKDGINFTSIGKIKSNALGHNSNEPIEYSFLNQHPEQGFNFYKLEQVDINDQVTYSNLISLYRSVYDDQIQIYPNPSEGEFNINIHSPMSFTIYDLNGREILKSESKYDFKFKLSDKGVYMIKFTDPRGNTITRKLIVN